MRVAATFPSLSTTSPLGTARGNTASPGEGSTSPAPSCGARGTRPRCCPRSGSRRPGGTRCGGSPGAGRCGSPAPGCRRWSVPPSCGLSPSPAAEGSPACRRWPRAASAHRPRPAPETRCGTQVGRAGWMLPHLPHCFWTGIGVTAGGGRAASCGWAGAAPCCFSSAQMFRQYGMHQCMFFGEGIWWCPCTWAAFG